MKNILIGITSSIAAYKICELIRMFKRTDYNVKVVRNGDTTYINFLIDLNRD